MPVSVT